MNATLPEHAQVVIIGGGIIGCSVAYHLAHLGWKDTILIEQNQITSGTTWHAAGLMTTFGSTSETMTELRKYTRDLYTRLEAETGQATGFEANGFIEVASTKDRLIEYRRVAAFNRWCNIDVTEISPGEVQALFPPACIDDVLAGFYVKQDGKVNPVDATMALAKGARLQGVRIFERVRATDIHTKNGTVVGVETDSGIIQTEYVVNCAGMWARQFGEGSGAVIPNQAIEHYYLITDTIKDLPQKMPVLEDPERYGYYRNESDGLMVGLFEPKSTAWKISGIPGDFSFGDIPPDWERMEPFLQSALSRVPVTLETGIKKFFCGPESFTPDRNPIVGEAPEIRNYFICAGLNSVGITIGPGLGRLLAHWITTGYPDMDSTCINANRFHRYQLNPAYRKARTAESLGLVYACHYPNRTPQTARGIKLSPFHSRLVTKGAYFKEVSGWESPDWYTPEGESPDSPILSWGREHWFNWWEAEHRACRENVIIMDMSFMSKFLVCGKDAGAVLNYISANEVTKYCNTITYTQWLNDTGTIEADLTVIKRTDTEYMVIATDTMHRHVEAWLRKNCASEAHVFVLDITSAYGQLNIQGPVSRALLQTLTSTDLSNDAFPFRRAQEIDIGLARVLCVRITYLGELGYELYIPAEQALHVYDQIVAAGHTFNLQHAGLKALSSLRLEKGYRDYGHDLDNTDTPYETGLGFAVNLRKKSDFIGKKACLKKKLAAPYTSRLVQVLILDPEPLMHHAEIVYRNNKPVGYVRSASYGFTLGGAVGLAMIHADEAITRTYLEKGTWTVDIAGTRYPALLSIQPLYDPTMERVKR